MLHAHRLRIHEVPVRMNARGFGRSSIDYPRSAYYMAKVLLAIFVGLFRRRPDAARRAARPCRAARSSRRAPAGRREHRRRLTERPGVLVSLAVEGGLDARVRIVAIVITAAAARLVLELVRRRRLVERYALLWMIVALALLVLAVWTRPARTSASDVARHRGPGQRPLPASRSRVVFLLLLHFSVAISRLVRGDEDPRPGGRAARRASCGAMRAAQLNGDSAGRASAPSRRAAPAPPTSRRAAAARSGREPAARPR